MRGLVPSSTAPRAVPSPAASPPPRRAQRALSERTTSRDRRTVEAHASPDDTAWTFLLVHGFLLVSGGLYWLFRGRFLDLKVYDQIGGASWSFFRAIDSSVMDLTVASLRFAGSLGVVAGVLVMAIAATAFRRYERWAWYAMLTLPFYVCVDLATLLGYRALSLTGLIGELALLSTALLGLVLPYRRFFPRAEASGAGRPENDASRADAA